MSAFGQHKRSLNAIVPASSVPDLIRSQQKIPRSNTSPGLKVNPYKKRKAGDKPQKKDDGRTEISEQQLKELHLIYEGILNQKKALMYDYINEGQASHRGAEISPADCVRQVINSACCCLTKFMPTLKYVKQYKTSLKIEAITCNKLSHCLFDFDCPNFNQYQHEKYTH